MMNILAREIIRGRKEGLCRTGAQVPALTSGGSRLTCILNTRERYRLDREYS